MRNYIEFWFLFHDLNIFLLNIPIYIIRLIKKYNVVSEFNDDVIVCVSQKGRLNFILDSESVPRSISQWSHLLPVVPISLKKECSSNIRSNNYQFISYVIICISSMPLWLEMVKIDRFPRLHYVLCSHVHDIKVWFAWK